MCQNPLQYSSVGIHSCCISLALYTDDFEICNPLGTSKRIYKITAVYWTVLNVPANFQSSLTSIQLALLGRSDVKERGYEKFLEPLIKDLGPVYYRTLEHFEHWLSVLRAFTLTEPAEFSALKVPGWRTANGQKMQCETMDTTGPKRAPSWLRSGRGGALSPAFI